MVDVISGGPVDEAGIKQGETILAIDAVSVDKLVLPEVRDKIRHETVGKKGDAFAGVQRKAPHCDRYSAGSRLAALEEEVKGGLVYKNAARSAIPLYAGVQR